MKRRYRKPSPTNTLTKAVQSYVNLRGGRLYRINVQGQYDPKLKIWRPSGSDKGVADLVGCDPAGTLLMVEVKVGKDTQSPDQRKVMAQVRKAGGIYRIVKTFDEFREWFDREYSL